jgi:hypothetical protein
MCAYLVINWGEGGINFYAPAAIGPFHTSTRYLPVLNFASACYFNSEPSPYCVTHNQVGTDSYSSGYCS